MASFKTLALAFGLVAGVGAIGADYVYNMAYSYSRGERSGEVFKFSEKGRLCKTWEGQMIMNGYGAVGGQGTTGAFEFTVMNKDVIEKVKEAQRTSEHVNLDYRQVQWKMSCFQESEYVVTDVHKIDANGQNIPFVLSVQPQQKRR